MHLTEKLAALRRVLGKEEYSRDDEHVFWCKNPDGCKGSHHKPKLSVNLLTDSFHCWVCGWKGGSLARILKLGDRNTFITYLGSISSSPEIGEKERKFDIPVLPAEFISLTDRSNRSPYYRDAIKYLDSRGIGFDEIVRFKLGYCESGMYSGRIVVPSFDDEGELNFFTGRAFYDKLYEPHMTGNFDKDIIFNSYMIDWSCPVDIVEGAFDMMKAGPNAVPLMGSFLREDSKLVKRLVMEGSHVRIALDSDAMKKQMRIATMLISLGLSVTVVNVGRAGFTDVGVMDKEQYLDVVAASPRMSDLVSMLRIKSEAMA